MILAAPAILGWLCMQAGPPRGAAQVAVAPGENLQSAVDRHAPGSTFKIRAGIHRLQSVQPKQGDTFVGEPGAILSGALELTAFQRQGRWWTASVHAEKAESRGECGAGFPACNLPDDLFIDNAPLRRMTTLEQVGPGSWYLDYTSNRAYLQDDPRGRKVEISVAQFAFAGNAPNVTIQDLTIEKYANVSGIGAVHGGNPSGGGGRSRNWLVESNEIRWNHGLGVWVGNAMRVLHNRLLHNGHMGVGGTGDDVVVRSNEIAFNNFAGYDYHWGAGGAKFVLSDRLELIDNFVHDNEGPGLWADIDCSRVLFERNRTRANRVAGLFFEISSGAIIRDNLVEAERENSDRKGIDRGAGILVNTSSDVEIRGNKVTGCPNGILAVQQDRGISRRTGAGYVLKHLSVHDNVVTQEHGFAAGVSSPASSAIDSSNRFENNVYSLGDLSAAAFVWIGGFKTIQEWNSAGNDRNGRFGPIR